jgi:hypothetical protein
MILVISVGFSTVRLRKGDKTQQIMMLQKSFVTLMESFLTAAYLCNRFTVLMEILSSGMACKVNSDPFRGAMNQVPMVLSRGVDSSYLIV